MEIRDEAASRHRCRDVTSGKRREGGAGGAPLVHVEENKQTWTSDINFFFKKNLYIKREHRFVMSILRERKMDFADAAFKMEAIGAIKWV